MDWRKIHKLKLNGLLVVIAVCSYNFGQKSLLNTRFRIFRIVSSFALSWPFFHENPAHKIKLCLPCYFFARKLHQRAASITRASGWGLGPGNQCFLGPVKWHRVYMRVPFGAQKTRDIQGPTPFHLPK
jgi:hypothetical protein